MRHAKLIALLTLGLCLSLVNWSIYKKEHLLAHGHAVFLKLAPVDPRSLMQGDYMALRFEMANQIASSLQADTNGPKTRQKPNMDGYAVVALDEKNIGNFVRLHRGQELGAREILMRFRLRSDDIKFATNAFFFQEGHAERYEPAEYGLFRVAAGGELLLVSLHDEYLEDLTTKPGRTPQ